MAEILDHRGEPIRRRELTREISGPTITGTRSIWTSALTRDITPARMAAILREAEQPGQGASERYVELAEIMEERDLHYLGVISTRKRQVAQIGITVEPASDSAEDVRDADLVRDCLDREGIEADLIDILDAIAKGYSAGEIIWDMSAREWRPLRIEHRLPQWFDFDRIEGRRLQMRDDQRGWVGLPAYKFVTHIASVKSGLPIRGGLARAAAFAWIAKTYTLRDWVQFTEVYGRPLRIGRYPPNTTPEEKAVLYRAVRSIAVDAAAIIPEGMLLEFIESKAGSGMGGGPHPELTRYVDAQMSIAVLGQTLTTQEGDSGSYALGAVHNLVREDIEQSDGGQLGWTLQRDLVIPIVVLNHGPRRRYPRIIIARASQPNLKMLAESLAELVPLGLRVRADQVRTIFGLDAPGEGDEVLEVPTPMSTDPPPAPPARARDAGGGLPRAAAAGEDDSDPLPALVTRTEEEIGPLVDEWTDQARRGLEGARSLDETRGWFDVRSVGALDISDVAARLGLAAVAAELAGRYDVEAPIALAAASFIHTQLPFDEQVEFFRSKLNLPTESWTDIWQSEHDRAFVVAGAMRDELLSDLRGAVDQSIADGTTIETFRREFDSIVEKRGWSYRGERNWRTRVIYETNLRSSYAAGRYQQMQDIAERRPYWRYRHSDASEEPRPEHVGWDGLVLRHDDPWWDTHYPPNGWGCKCFVETLGPRDMERLGKSGPDQAPQIRTRTVTVGTQGPTPRTVEVPEGIDPGWAYAPGRSVVGRAVRQRLDQSTSQPADIAAAGVEGMLDNPRALDALAEEWRRWRRESPGPGRPETFTLGALTSVVARRIRERGHAVESAAITATRRRVAHADRDRAHEWGKALGEGDLDRLPEIVAHPRAVLYDRNDSGTVLMVFDPVDEAAAGRAGKVVVRVDLSERIHGGGERHTVRTNSVRTAGYVEAHNLREPRYEVLDGEVE